MCKYRTYMRLANAFLYARRGLLVLGLSMACLSLPGCGGSPAGGQQATEANIEGMGWPQVVQAARGSRLNMMMWQGDPYINAYMQNYVKPALRQQYNITLNISPGQGGQVVNMVRGQIEAGGNSQIDMVWFNGETFYQLRQLKALYGPFTERLPNAQYIDFSNPFIGVDFQQPIEGFECPWGNVQMAWIYRSSQVPQLPQTRQELLAWAKENPGRFTWSTDFTGMTLLKTWLMDIAGGPAVLQGPYNEALYQQYSAQLWQYVAQLKPYLWKQGRTFPENLAQVHQMFANGELLFTLSNNDAEVDNKVLQGLFPEDARAYVPAYGSIQNSHYLGIINTAQHKAAAMVAINFLISAPAQLQKFDPAVWGDGTVLNVPALPERWQKAFAQVPNRKYAPARSQIQPLALQELAPEYMINLYNDFTAKVIGGQ